MTFNIVTVGQPQRNDAVALFVFHNHRQEAHSEILLASIGPHNIAAHIVSLTSVPVAQVVLYRTL